MPAVQPDRLRRQIQTVVDQLADPRALRRACRDFLEFHADRARRPAGGAPARGLGVSRPILQALARALGRKAREDPSAALAAAEALWRDAYREGHELAAALLGQLTDSQVPDLAARLVLLKGEARARAILAETGLRGWRIADRRGFLDAVTGWLRSGNPRLAAFGLDALTAAAVAGDAPVEPSIWEIIPSLQTARGEVERSLLRWYEAMAHRAPAETAHRLIAEVPEAPARLGAWLSEMGEQLPAGPAADLRTALLARGAWYNAAGR